MAITVNKIVIVTMAITVNKIVIVTMEITVNKIVIVTIIDSSFPAQTTWLTSSKRV
jgi:hypothetical protein